MIHGYCPQHGGRRYYGAIINGRKFCDAAGCQRMLRTERELEAEVDGDGFVPAHDGAHCSCSECLLKPERS